MNRLTPSTRSIHFTPKAYLSICLATVILSPLIFAQVTSAPAPTSCTPLKRGEVTIHSIDPLRPKPRLEAQLKIQANDRCQIGNQILKPELCTQLQTLWSETVCANPALVTDQKSVLSTLGNDERYYQLEIKGNEPLFTRLKAPQICSILPNAELDCEEQKLNSLEKFLLAVLHAK